MPLLGGITLETKYRSFDDLPLALRVEDLMPILGIGRNTAYELVRSGQIRSIKIGRQIRVPKDALADGRPAIPRASTLRPANKSKNPFTARPKKRFGNS